MTTDDAAGRPADGTYERGVAMVTEIYQGEVPALPEGTMAFNDVMMRSLFAEVWDRDVLSIRDRRLLIMGVIAARGSTDVWKLQAQSALKRSLTIRSTNIIDPSFSELANQTGPLF